MNTATENTLTKTALPNRDIKSQFEVAQETINNWPEWKKEFYLELLRKSVRKSM